MKLELTSRMLEDAKKCIGEGDPIQASEKLYKAAEEAIKVLSERFNLEEFEENKRGRWTVPLLFNAVRRLSAIENKEIVHWWDAAWFLHVEGFHEARLDIEQVKFRFKFIEDLVRFARGGRA